MKLSGARATCGALSGAMAQFINQVLTWYLTNGNAYDCVQAMVSFSWEGNALGAKARCYLSHDSSGQADEIVVNLNGHDPNMKYTGSCLIFLFLFFCSFSCFFCFLIFCTTLETRCLICKLYYDL